jgi:hypothetical protein
LPLAKSADFARLAVNPRGINVFSLSNAVILSPPTKTKDDSSAGVFRARAEDLTPVESLFIRFVYAASR